MSVLLPAATPLVRNTPLRIFDFSWLILFVYFQGRLSWRSVRAIAACAAVYFQGQLFRRKRSVMAMAACVAACVFVDFPWHILFAYFQGQLFWRSVMAMAACAAVYFQWQLLWRKRTVMAMAACVADCVLVAHQCRYCYLQLRRYSWRLLREGIFGVILVAHECWCYFLQLRRYSGTLFRMIWLHVENLTCLLPRAVVVNEKNSDGYGHLRFRKIHKNFAPLAAALLCWSSPLLSICVIPGKILRISVEYFSR